MIDLIEYYWIVWKKEKLIWFDFICSTKTARIKETVDIEAAKALLNAIIGDVRQLVEDTKTASAECANDGVVKNLQVVSQNAEKVIADAQLAIRGISSGNVASIEDALKQVSENAQTLIGEAGKVLIRAANSQKTNNSKVDEKVDRLIDDAIHGSGNILHKAIDKLGSAAQKVVDTSNRLNQGVHDLIGNTFNKVTGSAHKVVSTVTGILTWGKVKPADSSSA